MQPPEYIIRQVRLVVDREDKVAKVGSGDVRSLLPECRKLDIISIELSNHRRDQLLPAAEISHRLYAWLGSGNDRARSPDCGDREGLSVLAVSITSEVCRRSIIPVQRGDDKADKSAANESTPPLFIGLHDFHHLPGRLKERLTGR